jgi:hypothetical protein
MDFSIVSGAELFNESDEHVASLLLKQCFHQVFRINCSDGKHDKRFGGVILLGGLRC